MGREVRMIKRGWEHPKNESGKYIPLKGFDFETTDKEWSDGFSLWKSGKCPDGSPIEPKYTHLRFTEYFGERPSPDDYMPKWEDGEATLYVMYDASDGTPISPPFETPEQLARWLADNNASSFGSYTATYEQWLPICKGGWAPSMVFSNGKLQSGVEAMAEP